MRMMGSVFIICSCIFNGICWEVSKQNPDLYYRDCMMVPENDYSTMQMRMNESICPHLFYCWKSQLLTVAKANLTWIYNTFRNELAEKLGVGGMLKVNWHWMLEMDAIKIIRDCPPDIAAVIETRDIGGLDYRMSCEESITRIPEKFRTQTDFVSNFPNFLRDQLKEKGEYYKLPGVSHFACATMFTDEGALFVCIYCAKESRLSSENGCPDLYEKDKYSEFPNLCAHKYQKSIYGCEPAKLETYCTEIEPEYRRRKYNGSIRVMYAVTDGDNFLIYVNSDGHRNRVKPKVLKCHEQGGRCPALPAWNYVYDAPTLQYLYETVFLYTKNYINYGNYNVYIQINQTRRTITLLNGSCCTYVFVIFFLTCLPITLVMYFTYLHYKSHQA